MRARGASFLGRAIAFIHQCPFGLGGGKFHDEQFEGYVDTVYLGAFRSEVFAKIGLYNEQLVRNQDIELNSRIRDAGGKIYLTPEIKSYYYNRDTIAGFAQQNFRNGFWNIITTKINKNALSVRHFIPLLFILSIIGGVGLSFLAATRFWGVISLVGILGSYFLTALYFSVSALKEQGLKYFIIMPSLFFILHLSYGLGSLVGLINYRDGLK
jgi:GT2 family glycosyltransferase